MGCGARGFRCRGSARAAIGGRLAVLELALASRKAGPRPTCARLGEAWRRAPAEMAGHRAAVSDDDARAAATRPDADGHMGPVVAGRASGGARALQGIAIPPPGEEAGRSATVGAVPEPPPGKEARTGVEAARRNSASRGHGATARSPAGSRVAAAPADGARQCFAVTSTDASREHLATSAGTRADSAVSRP
jgi:hypothetical protein